MSLDLRVATGSSWPYRYEVVPIGSLFVDESYQRPLSRFVRRIVENFIPALLNTLVVSERADGTRAVIDGQTRLAALRELGHINAPCLIYEGLTLMDEARLFAAFQSERKNVSALERFRAALVAREPRAIEIADTADRAGFVIDKSNVGNSIVAVKALEETYDRHGRGTVQRVLEVVAGAWRFRSPASNTNEMLRGLAYFIAKNDVDDERLIRRLSLVDPGALHTRAGMLRQGRGHGGKSPSYMAEAIQAEYNRNRRRQ